MKPIGPGRAALVAGCGTLILGLLLVDGALEGHGAWRVVAGVGAGAALLAGLGEIGWVIGAVRRRG